MSYESSLKNKNIHVIHGTARFIDGHTIAVHELRFRAKHFIIATGGQPEVPDLPGASFGITSDQFFHLASQPQQIAVIGAGYIAIELAGVLAGLGSKVALVTRYDSVLRNFDSMFSEAILDSLRSHGVEHLPNSHVRSVLKNADGSSTIHLTGSQKLEKLDCVLWAVGRTPRTKALHLQKASVATDTQGYILVDEAQQTNIDHIYAIGDVTPGVQLTPVAIAAGRRLADRLYGGKKDNYLTTEHVATAIFSHPPAATCGLSESQANEKFGAECIKVYQAKFKAMIDAFNPLQPKTHIKMITQGTSEQVVGLHIVGPGADEMMQGFAVAINMGATKADFDDTIAIHPTSAEEIVTLR